MLLNCIEDTMFMSETKKRPPKPKDPLFNGRVFEIIFIIIVFVLLLFAIVMMMFPGSGNGYYEPSESMGY